MRAALVFAAAACACVLAASIRPAFAASRAADVAYVSALYQAAVHRKPTASELDHDAVLLDGGALRSQIARSVLSRSEFRALEIAGYYQSYLGRPNDPGAAALINSHQPLGQCAIVILSSREYFAHTGGTSAMFVTGLYRDLAGRLSGPSESQVLVGLLKGNPDRPLVAGKVWNSSDAVRHRVSEYSQTYSGRPVDPHGLAHYSSMLLGGATEEDVIAGMLSSTNFPNYLPRMAIAPEVFAMRALDAAFVSQSVPSTMVAGKPASVTLVFRNTGSTTWEPNQFGVECPDKCAWSLRSVLPYSIGPGKTYTFTFTIIAPTTPRTYRSQWQMFQLAPPGVGLFGQRSTTVPVQVVPPPHVQPSFHILPHPSPTVPL